MALRSAYTKVARRASKGPEEWPWIRGSTSTRKPCKNHEQTVSEIATPAGKGADRALRNFLSASAMLGHLCALYDRGVFEASRLMSNLLYQLAVRRRNNRPLIDQVVEVAHFRVTVDRSVLSSAMRPQAFSSPLVGLMFGLKAGESGVLGPAAYWLPAALKPGAPEGFRTLTLEEWLDDPVIPTSQRTLSRRDLILYVRDQDGGAHSDPDARLANSTDYVELVNSFPMSKASAIEVPGARTLVWDLLPPVTLPLLRQISHEMLSAIFSQTDVRKIVYLPSLVCLFEGEVLKGAFVPEDYPPMPAVHGKPPGTMSRGAFEAIRSIPATSARDASEPPPAEGSREGT
jgi:hypothetical protein